jgi:hypothetical protein
MKLIMSSTQSLRPVPLAKVDVLEIERDKEMEPHRRGRNGRLTLNAALRRAFGFEECIGDLD